MKQLLIVLSLLVASAAPAIAEGIPNPPPGAFGRLRQVLGRLA